MPRGAARRGIALTPTIIRGHRVLQDAIAALAHGHRVGDRGGFAHAQVTGPRQHTAIDRDLSQGGLHITSAAHVIEQLGQIIADPGPADGQIPVMADGDGVGDGLPGEDAGPRGRVGGLGEGEGPRSLRRQGLLVAALDRLIARGGSRHGGGVDHALADLQVLGLDRVGGGPHQGLPGSHLLGGPRGLVGLEGGRGVQGDRLPAPVDEGVLRQRNIVEGGLAVVGGGEGVGHDVAGRHLRGVGALDQGDRRLDDARIHIRDGGVGGQDHRRCGALGVGIGVHGGIGPRSGPGELVSLGLEGLGDGEAHRVPLGVRGAKPVEDVVSGGVRTHAHVDRIAQVVGAGQGDLGVGHPGLAVVLNSVAVGIDPEPVPDRGGDGPLRAGDRADGVLQTGGSGGHRVGEDVRARVAHRPHGQLELHGSARGQHTGLAHTERGHLRSRGGAGAGPGHRAAARRSVAPRRRTIGGVGRITRVDGDVGGAGVLDDRSPGGTGLHEGQGPVEVASTHPVTRQDIDDLGVLHFSGTGSGQGVGQSDPPLVELIGGLSLAVDLDHRGQSRLLELDSCDVGDPHLSGGGALEDGGGIALRPDHDLVGIHPVPGSRGDLSGQDDRIDGGVDRLGLLNPAEVGLARGAGRPLGVLGRLRGHQGGGGRGRHVALRTGQAVLHPHLLGQAGGGHRRDQGGLELVLHRVVAGDTGRGLGELAGIPLAHGLVDARLDVGQQDTVAQDPGMGGRVVGRAGPRAVRTDDARHVQLAADDPLGGRPVRQGGSRRLTGVDDLQADRHLHPESRGEGREGPDGLGQHRVDPHPGDGGVHALGRQVGIVSRDCGGIVVPGALVLTAARGIARASGPGRVLHRQGRHLIAGGRLTRVGARGIGQVVVTRDPYGTAVGRQALPARTGRGRIVLGLQPHLRVVPGIAHHRADGRGQQRIGAAHVQHREHLLTGCDRDPAGAVRGSTGRALGPPGLVGGELIGAHVAGRPGHGRVVLGEGLPHGHVGTADAGIVPGGLVVDRLLVRGRQARHVQLGEPVRGRQGPARP